MHGFVKSTLLVIVLTAPAQADVAVSHTSAKEAQQQPLDELELEQRALQLMIEKHAVERRQAALHNAIREIDRETQVRFFYGGGHRTGIYVDENTMRVTGVVRGSPGHTAGLRENDLVLEINDTIGGDEPDAGARLLWAFRRMNPGELVSVTYLRGDKRQTVQVPVITEEQLAEIRTRENAEALGAAERLERARKRQISRRQSHGVHGALGKDRLGVWDGLLLFSVAGGLGKLLETEIGVLVLESADPDHPLHAGDVLTRIGHNTPSDAQHAIQLLYHYEDQPLIPLTVERSGMWLELEMPYPPSERTNRS